ncbi:MAG: magnesium transporter, partial [Xanthobacteraceae bacterium]|nr:magnesium transporter [Xanthobacteraceae bacterium]
MTGIHSAPEGEFNAAIVAAGLTGEHVADKVDVLNRLEPEEAAAVLRLLPREAAVEILDKPELDFGAEILEALPHDVAVTLLTGLSADRAADIVQQLQEPHRTELMQGLDPPDPRRPVMDQHLGDGRALLLFVKERSFKPGVNRLEQVIEYV